MVHVLFVLDHQVDLSVGQLERQAFPGVEWEVFQLRCGQRINVLS